MRRGVGPLSLLLAVAIVSAAGAQAPAPAVYEVVSIKRNTSGQVGNSLRTLPDGTRIIVNSAVRSFIQGAAPTPVVDVEGLPSWAMTERWDITAKPPAGSTNEQRREMVRQMFLDRFKLVAHVEERERDVFDLTRARDDGRLGPNLRPTTVACTPGAPPPSGPLTTDEIRARCLTRVARGEILSGGLTLAALGGTLRGVIGAARVVDRTGLEGLYAVELSFAPGLPSPADAAPDDRPDIFTAVQEQLGLKLVRSRAMVPVLVVDSIDRPSPN